MEEMLNERGARYGDFAGHAKVSQQIQDIMRIGYDRSHDDHFQTLDTDVKESLFMIAHKLGRIVNGDPYYDDSWRDIAGYATLIVNKLNKEE